MQYKIYAFTKQESVLKVEGICMGVCEHEGVAGTRLESDTCLNKWGI